MLPCSITVRALSSIFAGRSSSRSATIDKAATAATPTPAPTQASAATRRGSDGVSRAPARRALGGGGQGLVVGGECHGVLLCCCAAARRWKRSPPPVTTHTRSDPATLWIPRSQVSRVTRRASWHDVAVGDPGFGVRGTSSVTGPASPCPSTTIDARRRRRRSSSPCRTRRASASSSSPPPPTTAHQGQREAELGRGATPPQRPARTGGGPRRRRVAARRSRRTSRGRAPSCAASGSPAIATTPRSTTRSAPCPCSSVGTGWRPSTEPMRRVLVGLGGGWLAPRGAGGRGVVTRRAARRRAGDDRGRRARPPDARRAGVGPPALGVRRPAATGRLVRHGRRPPHRRRPRPLPRPVDRRGRRRRVATARGWPDGCCARRRARW